MMPVVFIHGVGDSARSWEEVIAGLDARLEPITYDLRGHGTTETRPLVSTIDDFAADLLDELSSRGIDRADVVGFSLGGLIAQAVAVEHPERVRRLVVIGSVAGRTEEERGRAAARLADVTEIGPLAVAERSLDRWFSPGFLDDRPEVRAGILTRMTALDPLAYTAAYRVLASTDLIGKLDRIAAPTLAIAGEFDVGSPPRMSERIAEVSGGRAVVIPGVRHSLLHEAPTRITKEINDHLT